MQTNRWSAGRQEAAQLAVSAARQEATGLNRKQELERGKETPSLVFCALACRRGEILTRGGRAARGLASKTAFAAASWWSQIATAGYGLPLFVSKGNTMRKNFFFFFLLAASNDQDLLISGFARTARVSF